MGQKLESFKDKLPESTKAADKNSLPRRPAEELKANKTSEESCFVYFS